VSKAVLVKFSIDLHHRAERGLLDESHIAVAEIRARTSESLDGRQFGTRLLHPDAALHQAMHREKPFCSAMALLPRGKRQAGGCFN